MLNNRVPEFEELRVLLAEDNLFSQRLTRSVLNQLGIRHLTIVQDGAQAMELLDEPDSRFDLVISDWNMPKVTGLDLLRHVRETWENLPFLMLTGNQTAEFVRAAKENGVDAYIIKPFSPQQLSEKLKHIFNLR
jgi:two-component system chemotaxis response regulator CheY